MGHPTSPKSGINAWCLLSCICTVAIYFPEILVNVRNINNFPCLEYLVILEMTPGKGTLPGRDPLEKFTLDFEDASPFPGFLEWVLYLM